nr:MAG TPA: serine endopeptidase inhibitor [Caudoviricetes sp.]DAJ76151.1 MAG TPA: Serine endopeptidase inhibitor [Crassvirales sp.]
MYLSYYLYSNTAFFARFLYNWVQLIYSVF